MQTRTIERTETDERVDDGTDSDTPKYFHYVKKDKIAESAVMGTHVVALCGEVFPVTRAAKPGRRSARTASASMSTSRRADQVGRLGRHGVALVRRWRSHHLLEGGGAR